MAGHDLLSGCTTPWQHDCPGSLPSPGQDGVQLRTGGMICHCPCHRLERTIATLQAEVGRLAADELCRESQEYEHVTVDTVTDV